MAASIAVYKTSLTFPATGGSLYVQVDYSGASTVNDPYCSQSWVSITRTQQGTTSDGTIQHMYKITMSSTSYARQTNVKFSCIDSSGNEVSEDKFVLYQSAPETVADAVDSFITQMKVLADGTPENSSQTYIRCGYAGTTPSTPLVSDDWIHLGTGTEVNSTFIGYDKVMQYPVTFDANTGAARTGTVTFRGVSDEGLTLSSNCVITQAKASTEEDDDTSDIPVEGDEYIGQIWKDVEYNFGGVDQVEYGIYQVIGGEDILLFSGRSCKRPDAVSNTILINKVCQNYMTIPELNRDATSVYGGYSTFRLKSVDGNIVYKTYKFINDWSYDDYFATSNLSHPILNDNSKVAFGQYLPFTVFGTAEQVSVLYGIYYKDGAEDEWGQPVEDYQNTMYVKNEVVTEIFPYKGRNYEGMVSGYFIGDREYEVVDWCEIPYVLYYINPWGGYDWFPIRGKVNEVDDITQYTHTQNYNNTTLQFGKRRYLSEINKKYQLNTQWLREDESKRMWYLLESNTVYLHNIREDKIYPVSITNTQVDYKKRGRTSNRISYQIEVELSQTRERL